MARARCAVNAARGLLVSGRAARSGAWAASICLVILAGVFGWQWYQSRPKPVEIAYSVTPPGLTCYACDPPGEPQPLIVNFAASVAPIDKSGHALDAKHSGLTLRPAHEGNWSWDDDRTLRFTPANDWPIGKEYEVRIDRRDVIED